jgi:glycosyltransferase involved in cell wall biosynthesis
MAFRVLFDDAFFAIAQTGIARVWREVFTEIARTEVDLQNDVEFVILNRSDAFKGSRFMLHDFPELDFQHPAADRLLVSSVAKDVGADLFVSSYYTVALGIESLLPVYDLIPEILGFHQSERGWLERILAIVHAREYLAISQSTKNDLMSFYPFVSPSAVTVAHPGVDQMRFHRKGHREVEEFRSAAGLGDYVATVGSRYQTGGYKNFDTVLHAIESDDSWDFDLVLVGGEQITSREMSVCAAAGVTVRRLELDDSELATCLSGATALLYPSLAEGFGLPPLEALACGTPVIAVRSSSIPEVLGPLALYFDGSDGAELKRQIDRARTRSWQAAIQSRGPMRAQRFSWSSFATHFVDRCHRMGHSASPRSLDTLFAEYTKHAVRAQR